MVEATSLSLVKYRFESVYPYHSIILENRMARNYRKYTDDDIRKYVKEVKSLAGLVRKCGLKPAGGNFANMKRILQNLNIDTSHWSGKAWSKGEQLKDWNSYSRSVHVKPHLIKKRGHKCELCSKEWWLDNPIVLEVHHIDGNRTNNEYDNLQLLCCNCHATTDTWRNKKRLGHQTGI